ncbi:formate dehydrogenase subunit beta, partial [Klebsiella pneumoniae]|uniref:formate dehydrogenase N subunit beta transmembrane domain-containing protein n=1 Tax=Klebsiella pneumoniae TaxID=573 RepID=UPI0027D242A2
EPACVKTCPTGAIHFGTKEAMKQVAADRVSELNTRGYQNAGLYDPAGVGGTHVMYVLHHADKPQLYHGLPDNPSISPAVTFWKGVWTPLAAIGFAATFAASVFHYVGVGPNRVEDEDEHDESHDEETRK